MFLNVMASQATKTTRITYGFVKRPKYTNPITSAATIGTTMAIFCLGVNYRAACVELDKSNRIACDPLLATSSHTR